MSAIYLYTQYYGGHRHKSRGAKALRDFISAIQSSGAAYAVNRGNQNTKVLFPILACNAPTREGLSARSSFLIVHADDIALLS